MRSVLPDSFWKNRRLARGALFDATGKLLALRRRGPSQCSGQGCGLGIDARAYSSLAMCVAGERARGIEIIQKSLMAGIPVLASVSAASSLAVQMARELGMTLVGFLRGRRFLVYCGEERLGWALSLNERLTSRDRDGGASRVQIYSGQYAGELYTVSGLRRRIFKIQIQDAAIPDSGLTILEARRFRIQ